MSEEEKDANSYGRAMNEEKEELSK